MVRAFEYGSVGCGIGCPACRTSPAALRATNTASSGGSAGGGLSYAKNRSGEWLRVQVLNVVRELGAVERRGVVTSVPDEVHRVTGFTIVPYIITTTCE